MKSLIIGAGEVGTSLKKVIEPYHETHIRDVKPYACEGVDVLHICYPDHDNFVSTTVNYIFDYHPKLTVIHSSVRVGTTDAVAEDMESVVYSPVRGRHPNLEGEIRTYEKFVSGRNHEDVEMAFDYFRACDLVVVRDANPKGMELFKLLSNIHMGLEVAWRQEVQRIIKQFKAEPEAYEMWERSYADGYLKLGQKQLVRSRMKPDPIGGHCIIPCTEILKKQFPSKALDFILESNEKVKNGQG